MGVGGGFQRKATEGPWAEAREDRAVSAREEPSPCPPPISPCSSVTETPGEAQRAHFSFSPPPSFFAVVIEDDRIDDVLKTMTDKAPPGI